MAFRDLGHEPAEPYLVPRRKRARWKRVLAWVGGILLALVAVVVVGLYVLLYSQKFHFFVLNQAQTKASAALNTRVQLQNFRLHFHNLGLDLYGLTVYGTGPGGGRLLLQVDHVGLGVGLISILNRQWNLDKVTIDHPVVNLMVGPDRQNNLPTMQSSGNSKTNVFDLAIRHIVLDQGVVYYNDRMTPLYADLNDLEFKSNYNAADNGQYSGLLSYRDGHLQYGNYAPMAHDLKAQFNARREGMTLSNLKLSSGPLQLLLNASLDNYASPRLHAKYDVILALAELRNLLHEPTVPNGMMVVNGTADYSSVPGRAAIETTSLQGSIRSRVLQVRMPSLRTDIRELEAEYSLADGNAELSGVSAQLLGGMLRANATVHNVTGNQRGRAVVTLRGISLADLRLLANSSSLKPVALSGQVNANSEATWSGSIKNILLRADAFAKANAAPSPTKANATPGSVPLNAELHARYNGRTQEVALSKSYVQMPRTSLTMDGTVGQHSALNVRLQTNDLHELETVADIFSPPSQPLNLHGVASFEATVRGSTSAPQITGQLNARNVQLRGSAFRSLRANVRANPSQAGLQNGDLELANQQGHVTFNLQTGLRYWSHLPTSPFNAKLSVTQVSVAELAQVAKLSTPLSGTLNANVTLQGSQLNPIGQGDVSLRNSNISGEPVQLAQVRFQGTGDAVHGELLVRISAGTARGQLTYYPKQEGYDAVLQATNIHLEQLQSLRERNLHVSGTLNLNASGRGTLKDPQATASLTIPQLTVQQQRIANVNFHGTVTNHEAAFTLGSEVASTPLKAQGKVALTGDYYADLALDTPVIPLQPVFAAYAPSQSASISGQTEIHATVRGPLKHTALLEAHLRIPTLGVNYLAAASAGGPPANLQIAAAKPIEANYRNGMLSLEPGEIKGTDTDVHFQGQTPLSGNGLSTLTVQGAINLAIAKVFDPTLASSGQIQFDINAAGHKANENVQGEVRIVNAGFSRLDAPVGLSNGNGVLLLRRDRLDISTFTGNVGGGTVTASGGVAYRPALQFNLALKGSGLHLLYPPTVRTDLGLNLTMTGTTEAALLAGQVNISSVSFTPDFDLMNFANQFNGVPSPPPTQSFADNVKLNIAVRSTSELNVVSPTVSIQGNANLRVIGTAADPVIVGRTNLTGGDLIVLGNRYTLQGGTIAFVNTVQTEPVLNLQVNTTIKQYNIAIRFRGPFDRLQTHYTSDPALSQADIIRLIAFGSTEEAANAAPQQSTTLGAKSLVASQVSSKVTGQLEKALGVSQISLDPQLGSATANQQQGARLTVRQRVSSKLFVTFSTDVTTTQYSTIQLEYQLNRKWSVSGVRDQNGGFGLNGRYHKDF